MDLRGHIQTQDPFRIGNFEAGIVENRIIHFLWRRENIFELTFVARLRIAQHGKPGLLPRMQVNYISLRNLRFHQHGAHIGQGQNVRCLLGGNNGLPLQGSNLCYFASHWRNDAGVIKIGFRRIERGLITLNLRVNCANLRLFDRHFGGRRVEILL